MIKTITDEQREYFKNLIQQYKNEYRNFPPTDKEASKQAIFDMYKSMGQKKPLIIFGKNPIETAIKCGIFKTISKNKDYKSLRSELRRKLDRELYSELDRELDSELRSELGSELYRKLDSELYSELYRGLDSELGRELRSELYSELDRELDSELRSELGRELYRELYRELDSELRSELGSKLDSELGSELGSELYRGLDSELGRELRSELYSELDRELDSELYSELYRELGGELKKTNNNWYLSLWWRYWDCYYQFGKYIGAITKNLDKLDLFHRFTQHCYFVIPYNGVCFVSENPIKTHFNNKRLHRDGGSCIEFQYTGDKSTLEIFRLNGIKVSKELATTPAGLLNIEMFKQEKNADVKAEFIRKYGIDRMVDMGTVIDTWENYAHDWWDKSEYKLIDMSPIFTSVDYAPHLYMKNQTTGIYHLEAVTPDCKNLEEAMSKVRWNGRNLNNYKVIDIK